MSKMHILSFLLPLSFLTLTSCNEEPANEPPKPTITLSTDHIDCPSDGNTYTVTVQTNADWSAYSDDSDWITVKASNGTVHEGTVEIVVSVNQDTVPRTGSMVAKSGASRATCTITQAASAVVKYSDLCPLDGYRLVWQDEFERDGILHGDWSYQTANAGWVNNEKQTYVDQTSPNGKPVAECSKGTLKINLFKEGNKVYSGRVYACRNRGWKYGYFEASIRLPKGKGTWPAFWMMPVNFTTWPGDGEIDIMEEVGVDANWTSSSIHTLAYNHTKNTQKTAKVYTKGAEEGFHTYALEWTPDYIRSFVDGKELLRFPNDGKGDKATWPYNAPFYLILNVAWGGDWGGYAGVDDTALPTDMEIDYVRVFQKP